MKEKRETLSIASSVSCYYLYFCCFYCPNCQRPMGGKKTIRCNHCFYFFGLKTKPTKSFPAISLNQFYHFKTRTSGEGCGNPLRYSCLGYPMDRGAWWATVHGVAKSWHNWASIQSFLRGGKSLRKVETLAKGPRAFDGRARTMQASWSWPLSPDMRIEN